MDLRVFVVLVVEWGIKVGANYPSPKALESVSLSMYVFVCSLPNRAQNFREHSPGCAFLGL